MMRLLIFIILFVTGGNPDDVKFYLTNHGNISFRSEAQQEIINAASNKMVGIIDVQNRTFVFKVSIRSFNGFNSALQQEHFNEKYLESEKYPEAYFTGKIIEDLDLSINGNYDLRAKGKLNIHGVDMERIIRGKANVSNGKIDIESHFRISLSDHNIKIPKVVHEKIASEIIVDLKAELIRKDQVEK